MTPIVLIGAGGHARAVIDVIETTGAYTIAGLVGLPEEIGTTVLGYPVLGGDEDIPRLVGEFRHAIVTLGQIKSPNGRIRLFDLATRHGATLPVVISTHAHVSRHATVAAGTIVMHGAIVNAGATIGRNVIVNSQALVEHDATIADHCHVSTGARINSGVRVGGGTFIGSNASVRQALTIGERVVVGMGERVLCDLPDGARLPPKVK